MRAVAVNGLVLASPVVKLCPGTERRVVRRGDVKEIYFRDGADLEVDDLARVGPLYPTQQPN